MNWYFKWYYNKYFWIHEPLKNAIKNKRLTIKTINKNQLIHWIVAKMFENIIWKIILKIIIWRAEGCALSQPESKFADHLVFGLKNWTVTGAGYPILNVHIPVKMIDYLQRIDPILPGITSITLQINYLYQNLFRVSKSINKREKKTKSFVSWLQIFVGEKYKRMTLMTYRPYTCHPHRHRHHQ